MTFIQFCEAHGLVVDRITAGKWVRVKTVDKLHHRNGAYKFMGDHGFVQNHATMDGVSTWRAVGEVTPAQKRQNDAVALANQVRQAEYQARQIKAMRAYWKGLPALRGGHPYLDGKALDMRGCGDLRIDGELLVVPVMRDGMVMSLQTIAHDGQKRFSAGCPVKGGVHLLDRPGAVLTCFVEGFATGLAVYQSIHQCRVVVCFDSGNLIEVAKHYQGRGLGVVCADNDHGTLLEKGFNPGVEAALKATQFLKCGIAYPEKIKGTDWCDFLQEKGIVARPTAARLILSSAKTMRHA